MNRVEEISARIRNHFVDQGIYVQAFICKGTRKDDPLEAGHCWIIEKDYIFSAILYEKEDALIQCGTGADGRITIAGGFFVQRVPMDEEILQLINELGN
jgi:hypothetical protein